MMNTYSKTANFRTCDICLHKRALWFCAADDAFLCQSCDTSVHSANQLASRHERVRLEIETKSSWKIKEIKKLDDENSSLVWHHGFTKKPRTPRIHKSKKGLQKHDVLVPEISSSDDQEIFPYENEEQLLFRVPVLDPFDAESFEMDDISTTKDTDFVDLHLLLNNHEELASRMEIDPDVELEDLCGFEGLCEIGLKTEVCLDKGLKFEEENQEVEEAVTDFYYDPGLETTSESFNWDFDYSSSPIGGVEEELKMKAKQKRGINLKLNHEAIICAWDCQSSPWMNGIRPDFNLDDCWPDFMEVAGCTFDENPNGASSGRSGGRDEEREARVLRYKEKRRTRLFAKKIRYEVRKLNAEKRPRMKGRFVKRTAFAASSLPCYLMNKQ